MKLLLAIIQPPKLNALRDALARIGVHRMTVCDAHGYARQRGQTATYRGNEYKTNLLRKAVVEIAVDDDDLEPALEVITNVSRTGSQGNIGDGKVFVMPLDEVVSIRDGLRGPSAC